MNRITFLKNFGFCLGGGTAVAIYFGHRLSLDLDFFKIGDLDINLILPKFKKLGAKIVYQNINTLYFDIESIKISLFGVDFNFLEPCFDCNKFFLMSKLDLTLMKLVAIMQRGTFKDYVDLYFLLKEEKYDLENLFNLLELKYGIKINGKVILDAMVYLDDLKEDEVQFIGNKITKRQIYQFFKKLVKDYYETS